MITPRLFELTSIELDPDALPSDPENCSVIMHASIGPSGGDAADGFSFTVTTPSALAEAEYSGWGRGTLIVTSFSWVSVKRSVNRLLANASRSTWAEVASELNKELLWEFDNYHQTDG